MKITELVVNEYQIAPSGLPGGGAHELRNITLRRQPQRHGPDKWAIYDGQSVVLDKDGDWQHEPLPSSRTEEYLRLCRFDSAEEALAFYEQYKARSPQ